ncbi:MULTISPECIES: Mor transcription activator family protein [unclassified Psychrobacter]|uniref:Mor transcription activator family protein n=1 Tax=unclassified Psychrobacter TaxID=196806 RepID=UPI0018F5C4D7|nr:MULTISPECIES: Mor transcription activator family protein [unclassified Psychrobacter]
MPNLVTKTYQDLEMLLGHEAASKLTEVYRGQELYIPAPDKLSAGHNLVVLLGNDQAQRLCHYWQGNILTLPMQHKKALAERNAAIIEKYKTGTGKGALATEYNLHVRTVRKIIENYYNQQAKQAYNRLQLCLFDMPHDC